MEPASPRAFGWLPRHSTRHSRTTTSSPCSGRLLRSAGQFYPSAGSLPRVLHPQFPARTTRFGSPVTPCGAPSSLAHTHPAVTCTMRPSLARSAPWIEEQVRLSTSRRTVAHPEVVFGSTSNGCPRICARRAAADRLGSSRRSLRQVDSSELRFPKTRTRLGRSISRLRLPGIRLLRRRSVPVGCPRTSSVSRHAPCSVTQARCVPRNASPRPESAAERIVSPVSRKYLSTSEQTKQPVSRSLSLFRQARPPVSRSMSLPATKPPSGCPTDVFVLRP